MSATGSPPSSLRRARPTESSLTRAARQPRNINPYYPTTTSTTGQQTGRKHRMRATDPRSVKPAPGTH
jgi:hypothetical protein